MKPCSKNRKPITWLALDALDTRKAAGLRDHLARCEGCRRYFDEVLNVTQGLVSAAPDSDLQASEFFHHRLAERLQAPESRSVLNDLAAWLRGSILNWRVAGSTLAVLGIALFAIVAPRHQTARTALPPVPAAGSESDLAPTLANYQMVANQSPEKLSDLLTTQGNKSLPPAPCYTISGLEPANGSF